MKPVGTQAKASKQVASQGCRRREGRTKKKKQESNLQCAGVSQFYKIRVPMVRRFIRSELRLVTSKKDEQDREVDHTQPRGAVAVMSHGTDHSLGCMSPCQARIYSRVIQPIQSKYVFLDRANGPTSYSRGDYAHIRK